MIEKVTSSIRGSKSYLIDVVIEPIKSIGIPFIALKEFPIISKELKNRENISKSIREIQLLVSKSKKLASKTIKMRYV